MAEEKLESVQSFLTINGDELVAHILKEDDEKYTLEFAKKIITRYDMEDMETDHFLVPWPHSSLMLGSIELPKSAVVMNFQCSDTVKECWALQVSDTISEILQEESDDSEKLYVESDSNIINVKFGNADCEQSEQ